MNESSFTRIRNFLTVIIGGTLSGILIVLVLLYTYGPSDTYKAQNVLLSPDVLEKLWYNTTSASTQGQMNRFTFKEIEFLYFDQDSSRYISHQVPLSSYGEFYRLVKRDLGVANDEGLEKEFDQTPPASILIKATTNGNVRTISENFQQIQFSQDSNVYRVELKEEEKSDSWAYFTHNGIYNKVMKILQP